VLVNYLIKRYIGMIESEEIKVEPEGKTVEAAEETL